MNATVSFTLRHKLSGLVIRARQLANGHIDFRDESRTCTVAAFAEIVRARIVLAYSAEFEAAAPARAAAPVAVEPAPAPVSRKPRARKADKPAGKRLKPIAPRNGAKLPSWGAIQSAFYRAGTDLERHHIAKQGADLYRATFHATPAEGVGRKFARSHKIGVQPGKCFEAIEAVLAAATVDVITHRIAAAEGWDSETGAAFDEFVSFQADSALYGPDAVEKVWTRFAHWIALAPDHTGDEEAKLPSEFYAPPSHALALAFL